MTIRTNKTFNSKLLIKFTIYKNTFLYHRAFNIYIWLRFGLANAINNYLGLKICVGNF